MAKGDYQFKCGETVIVARGEPGEVQGQIVGVASVTQNGKLVTLYVVDIGGPYYIEKPGGGTLGTVSMLNVHPDNLYPVFPQRAEA